MHISDDELFQKAVESLKAFYLSSDDCKEFCDKMFDTMSKGLQKSTREKSSIKMFPSYVTKIPSGHETGDYIAIDLGGTNYRVLVVTLNGKAGPPEIIQCTYNIPVNKRTGSGEELFDYIASTLVNFLDAHDLKNNHYKLGFTFSFPCEQIDLNVANLVCWTKGFTANGVEGKNVSALLQDAIKRKGLDIECVAVLNDTVATLASCALNDSKCAIGLIIGTGTNAAYVEQCDQVEIMKKTDAKEVVINTEWGAFGEMGEIEKWRTTYDKILDEDSLHPGKQIFEKMVSGMYLGELVRIILVDLIKKNLLFRGQVPDSLNEPGKLLTKYLSDVERDPIDVYCNTEYMLTQDLQVPITQTIDNKIVRYVCESVIQRAADLAACAVSALLCRVKRNDVTVGIDGSLFKFHPNYCKLMTNRINELRPQSTRFCLRQSEDGSGKGAAAIAAAASTTTTNRCG